uniref:Lysozyme n=1 Tax=Acrobeloides nanus TaxID=290746 RepID=A0A914EBN9_9BILA
MKLVSLIAFVLIIRACYAILGFDVYQSISEVTFQCLAKNGYSFFIGRMVIMTGDIDNAGIQNIKNARSAGFTNVDGYISPCTSGCASPSDQVQAAINATKNAGTTVGTIWLDVETFEWTYITATNIQFITDMVNTIQNNGYKVGIYTTDTDWNIVFGAWTGASSFPLWWLNYDNQTNFNNFSPFGGWDAPTIKQYNGGINGPCGVPNLNLNWRP